MNRTQLHQWSVQHRTAASVAVLAIATTALVVAAVNSDGYHATKLNLDDASVWVFNTKDDYVGRLNSQTKELDSAVRARDLDSSDLWQRGQVVTVGEPPGPRSLNSVSVTLGQSANAARGLILDARAGVGVIVDQSTQKVWVGQDLLLASFTAELPPTITEGLSDQTVAAISADGDVVVVDPLSATFSLVRLAEDLTTRIVKQNVPLDMGLQLPADQLTVVGERPVFLQGSNVIWPGRDEPVPIDDVGLVLQQPGPASDRVVVSGTSGLWAIDFGSGSVSELVVGSGLAARPVVLGGCVHAAWAGGQIYAQKCGDRPAVTAKLNGVGAGERLTFRVNGRIIALNGENGTVFLVDGEALSKVDNWDDVTKSDQPPPPPEDTTEDLKPQECSDELADPLVTSDTYGAQPGQTVIMRVLDNDRDANCDALVVLPPVEWDNTTMGTLSIVDHGQAFQFQAPLGAPDQTLVVDYEVSDRSGNFVAAQAIINVRSSHLAPPQKLRESHTTVELGKSVTYNVLVDVRDPDGDSLRLVDVKADDGEGEFEFGADGIIRYKAVNTTPDPKTLDAYIDDGWGNQWKQPLIIDVRPAETAMAPTARNDYVTGRAGTDLIVLPLANDTDPNEDPLFLTVPKVDLADADAVTISQGDGDELHLRASRAGDFRITYFVSDGTAGALGVIRFKATEAANNEPPVAVSDSVTVHRSRSVNVDVLANDFDADGDVLVVTDARGDDPTIGEVDVVVVQGRYVRVTIGGVPDRPVKITYTISDGRNAATSAQLLVQVSTSEEQHVPIAVRDEAIVRVGDVVTIDVLANDSDADGDQLVITGVESTSTNGTAWISDNKVRFLAGDIPGGVDISYDIDDSPLRNGLHSQTAQVHIDVKPLNEDNLPPQPRPLQMRVYAGGTARLEVPVDGVDPEGDSVHLVGFGPISDDTSTATKGSVSIDGSSFVYDAWFDSSGGDTFTYQLEDALGARSAPSTVLVTIVQSPNHSPALARDELTVRPGRVVLVPVLANDSDPDGDELTLEDTVLPMPGSEQLEPTVVEGRVRVRVPDAQGTYVALYTVTDGRGGESTQALTIHSDPLAPLLPPAPRNDPDRTTTFTFNELSGVHNVTIKLFDNDDDPDNARTSDANGNRSDIVLTNTDLPVINDSMTIEQTNSNQLILYTVVDTDQLRGSALVVVPKQGNSLPRLSDDFEPITVALGETKEILIADYVVDPDAGDKVLLVGSGFVPVRGIAAHVGEDLIKFTFMPSPQDDPLLFQAQAKVSFEVTDKPGDASHTVRLELPITITFDGDLPIRTTDAKVEVEKGADGKSINLLDAGFVDDPNEGGEPTFEGLASDNPSARIVDPVLTPDGELVVRVLDGAAVGATETLHYVVRHGDVSATGTISVSVVPSTRPKPVANNFSFDRLKNSESVEQDVSEGAVNSFVDQGEPLILQEVSQPPEGAGTIESFTGSTSVRFTPNADFAGTVTVYYRVADFAHEEAFPRVSTGSITYNVIGPPLQPPAPTVESVRSHTVVLNIGSSDPNFWQGSRVDAHYIVRWPGGEQRSDGATQITIENLPNNVPVQFTVTGVNDVDSGPTSAPSQQVRPDQLPDRPNPPRVTVEGDTTLMVVWDAVVPDGSPVQGYQLLASDPSVVISELSGSTTSYLVTGLQNGVDVAFALIARNLAETNGGKSEMSTWSSPGRPYTLPLPPTNIQVNDDPSALGDKVIVSWTASANDGGRLIDYYLVGPVGGPSQQVEGTSTYFQLPGGTYTFSVKAHNLRGPSTQANSAPYSVVNKPAPVAITGSAEAGSGAVQLTIQPPSNWGNTPSGTRTYEYSLNGGGYATLSVSNPVITGLVNCRSYQVVVRARNERYPGDSTASTGITAWGPPNAPTGLSGAGSGTSITWNWDANGSRNGDCATTVSVQVDGSQISNALSGPQAVNYGEYNQGHNLTVVATDNARGTQATSGPVGASTGSPPPPPVVISWGSLYPGSSGSCTPNECKFVVVSASGFSPNQGLTVQCFNSSHGTNGAVIHSATPSGTYNRAYFIYAPGGQTSCTVDASSSNSLPSW